MTFGAAATCSDLLDAEDAETAVCLGCLRNLLGYSVLLFVRNGHALSIRSSLGPFLFD